MKKIRYAVVGLGHIAQTATLPAFKNARRNSELTALVSDDPVKLKKLGRQYKVKGLYSFDDFEVCLKSGLIDAVYIATPNTHHREYAEMAARHGIHVLCEKPLAITESDCRSMIDEARRKFAKHDQFGPELLYFSDCILKNRQPEPSGLEGLADVRILQALQASARSVRPVKIQNLRKKQRPSPRQEIRRPAVRLPAQVHVQSPSGGH